jgi:hypothetical protein
MTKRVSGFQVVPHSRLVAHEIRFERPSSEHGPSSVIATVRCERRNCRMTLDQCRACPRFARIDVHEAGYVMLCRSTDEEPSGQRATDSGQRFEEELP